MAVRRWLALSDFNSVEILKFAIPPPRSELRSRWHSRLSQARHFRWHSRLHSHLTQARHFRWHSRLSQASGQALSFAPN